MDSSLPEFTAAWTLPSQRSGIESLGFVEKVPIPPLRDDELLVKIHAASLNYRDLIIAKVRTGTRAFHIEAKALYVSVICCI